MSIASLESVVAVTTSSLAGCRIAVIGAGTMGSAIASGLGEAGVFSQASLTVVDVHRDVAERLAARIEGAVTATLELAMTDADIVLVCVKPKDVPEVLDALARARPSAPLPLVLSIAAGVTIASIESRLPAGAAVIRAMPNTASQIRKGCTVLSRGSHAG